MSSVISAPRDVDLLPYGDQDGGGLLVVLTSPRAVRPALALAASSIGSSSFCTVLTPPSIMHWEVIFMSCNMWGPWPSEHGANDVTADTVRAELAKHPALSHAEVLVTGGNLFATITSLLRHRDHRLVVVGTRRWHGRRAQRIAAAASRFCKVEVA